MLDIILIFQGLTRFSQNLTSFLMLCARLQQMCDAMSPKKQGEGGGGKYRTVKEVEELEC
jgi:hypothetical protein